MPSNPRILRRLPNRSACRRNIPVSLEHLEDRCLLSLVAAYSFNDGSGTTLKDLSGNGNNGTISNATWTSSGKYGSALSFNGTNSIVTVNDSASLDLTTGMTLEAWVLPSTVSNWRSVALKEQSNGLVYGLYSSDDGSKPGAYINTGGSDLNATGSSSLSTTAWVHLATTYDGSRLRLYVNGNLARTTVTSGSIATSNSPLRFGGNTVWGEYFQGRIDEVRIYNNALSRSAIQTDMKTEISAVADKTPPSVSTMSPANNANGIAVSTKPTATFDESVQGSSIQFVLTNASNTVIPSTVSYTDSTRTATLSPSSPLAASTTYKLTVSGAKDLSGNTMTTAVTSSFVTAAVDTTSPTVISQTPASNAKDVAVATGVSATFSESVQSSTISFVLANSSNTSVAATLSYDAANRIATLAPNSSLAKSTTYTATLSGAKDLAGNTMKSVSWSFTTAASAATGTTYYVSASASSGSGTLNSPYGLSDLLDTSSTPVTQGPALKALRPGDTLYFRGGTYTVNGSSSYNYWINQLISPTVSGTAAAPITLASYPGETATFKMTSGVQPLFGTTVPTLNYVRFIGLTIEPLTSDHAISLSGTGNEVAYCKITGTPEPSNSDNFQGIWLQAANESWIHHNDISGFICASWNGSAIKVYASTKIIVEDNYLHNNCVGIFDKDGGNNWISGQTSDNTYRRNYLTGNTWMQFLGNNQAGPSIMHFYDNVVDGEINLGVLSKNNEVYNNLLRTSDTADGKIVGICGNTSAPTNTEYHDYVWNNIVLTGGASLRGFWNPSVAFTVGQSTSPLAYMDYNVFDGTPSYEFGEYINSPSKFTLTEFQGKGFEQHTSANVSPSNLFVDQTSYVLKGAWATAGRYGDAVGPRFSVAQILNLSRYGPGARNAGGASNTQKAQNQAANVNEQPAVAAQVAVSGGSAPFQGGAREARSWSVFDEAIAAYTMAQLVTEKGGLGLGDLVSTSGVAKESNKVKALV